MEMKKASDVRSHPRHRCQDKAERGWHMVALECAPWSSSSYDGQIYSHYDLLLVTGCKIQSESMDSERGIRPKETIPKQEQVPVARPKGVACTVNEEERRSLVRG